MALSILTIDDPKLLLQWTLTGCSHRAERFSLHRDPNQHKKTGKKLCKCISFLKGYQYHKISACRITRCRITRKKSFVARNVVAQNDINESAPTSQTYMDQIMQVEPTFGRNLGLESRDKCLNVSSWFHLSWRFFKTHSVSAPREVIGLEGSRSLRVLEVARYGILCTKFSENCRAVYNGMLVKVGGSRSLLELSGGSFLQRFFSLTNDYLIILFYFHDFYLKLLDCTVCS